MMKKLNKVVLFTAFAIASSTTMAQQQLSGNQTLACGAVLCLSSSVGSELGACWNPYLNKYFSIQVFDRWGLNMAKTIKERINFLNLCPASSAANPNMPELIEAIGHGAGRCDAEHLNKYQRVHGYWRYEYRRWEGSDNGWVVSYSYTPHSYISSVKPNYCRVYEDHNFTDLDNLRYVGDELTGGFWVESSKYDAALQRYNDSRQPKPRNATFVTRRERGGWN